MINFIHSVGYGIAAFIFYFVLTCFCVRNKPQAWIAENSAALFLVGCIIGFCTFCITL